MSARGKGRKKKRESAPPSFPSHTATAPINVSTPSAAVISESRRAKKRSVLMHLSPVVTQPFCRQRLPPHFFEMAKKCSASSTHWQPRAPQRRRWGALAPAAASTTDAAGGGRCGGSSGRAHQIAATGGKMKRGWRGCRGAGSCPRKTAKRGPRVRRNQKRRGSVLAEPRVRAGGQGRALAGAFRCSKWRRFKAAAKTSCRSARPSSSRCESTGCQSVRTWKSKSMPAARRGLDPGLRRAHAPPPSRPCSPRALRATSPLHRSGGAQGAASRPRSCRATA